MMVYVVTHEEDYDGLYTVVDAVFKNTATSQAICGRTERIF